MDLFEPLSSQELALVDQLKTEVQHIVQGHSHLQLFCNDWTYVRYLRARGWDLSKATKMLIATLQWRLQAAPHAITWGQVEGQCATGKTFVSLHHDNQGRPVVIMRPRNENSQEPDRQLDHLIYCLEHASRLADAQGVGKMTWLIDFEGYSMRNAPPIRVSINVMQILQNHYPERLGGAVCYHAPSLFSMTWRAVSPWIDPVTKKKIAFVDKGKSEAGQMAEWFNMAHIEPCMGGSHPGDLFVLSEYRARMLEEDAALAAALKLVAAKASPTSNSIDSNMSEGDHLPNSLGAMQQQQQAVAV